MKNIEMQLAKPYQRDATASPQKISFSAEFDSLEQALSFMRDLNSLIIAFNDNKPDVLDTVEQYRGMK